MRTSLLVTALFLAFWGMAVSVSPRVGETSDERVHLVGGYSYWTLNDYRLQPENGSLPMRVQALPLLPMGLRFPPLDSTHFRTASANDVGHLFLFGSGNPFTSMLARARMANALFGVLALWLVWRWARNLFGPAAGWLALGLGVFCPTLLAHSGLATSDAAITACFLAAIGACWQLLHRATWPRLLIASIAVAAALLAKFSAVLLAPIALVLLALRWAHPAPLVLAFGGRTRWIRRSTTRAFISLGLAAAPGTAALVLVWGAYGFRYSTFNPQLSAPGATAPQLAWEKQFGTHPEANPDLVTRAILAAREYHLLPEAYLYGFTDSYKGSRSRPAFLMGEIGSRGWPQFFPIAFALKTPPTLLLLSLAGIAALALARRRSFHSTSNTSLSSRLRSPRLRWPRHGWLYRGAPLLVLFFLYWAVAINTPLNIGHRHLLPIYPVVLVAAGAAAGWLVLARRRALAAIFLAGVMAAHAIDSWATRPFYLGYFAPWAGGTERGWHYLVDSSLDWGQGLPDLATWIANKEASGDRAPIFLTYFGTDSPEARKLPITRFGDLFDDLKPRNFPAQVRGGWFVVSATYFQGVYLGVGHPWTAAQEKEYRTLLDRLLHAPRNLAALSEAERLPWAADARNYERLQFGRLVDFLRSRQAEAFIGGSLLAFRLSDAEVQRALYGPPPN